MIPKTPPLEPTWSLSIRRWSPLGSFGKVIRRSVTAEHFRVGWRIAGCGPERTLATLNKTKHSGKRVLARAKP
jgi:hypothetical protein